MAVPGQGRVVARGDRLAARVAGVEMRQLHPQDRRLQLVEPAVHARPRRET